MSDWSKEETERITDFFALLLKVDRRVNPHLYEGSDDLSKKIKMFETINTKKYLYWTTNQFVEEMKTFHRDRALDFMNLLTQDGTSPREAMRQLQQKENPSYGIFLQFNDVGKDDFFQEVFTCLSFIDFFGKTDVEGVAFPVKDTCTQDVHLTDLKPFIENDSEYDFLIKKNDLFVNFQLKSAPEKYIQEFNAKYFVDNIIEKTAHYNDPEMVLVYLLQPSAIRTSSEGIYNMINEICAGIGDSLPIRNIFFTGRHDLQTFEFIQVYKQVDIKQININDTIAGEIRNSKPF